MKLARLVLLSVLLGAPVSLAAQGPIRAVRTPEPPKLDGRPDDAVWQRAPPYTEFVEQFPDEGRVPPAPFRTEVRVLYDDRTLYILVVSHDPEPNLIQRQLGRRDTPLVGDQVEFAIDSTHQGRSGYYFGVNAAGVLRDGLFYGDVNLADTWDAVWDAAVAILPDGWCAELAIPLDLFRFPRAPTQEWGFFVRRTIHRTHQTFDSFLIPRSANGLISRVGVLTGLDGITPHRAFQVTPYATARLQLRPQYSDPAFPKPRLTDPSADVGADLRWGLTSDLTLNAAINPDFGQVEADQVVLNLSNQEIFFPEKRPFFNQGLELFQPVGAEFGPTPMQQFYSRRIGLDTPILVAGKVTGTGWKGLDVGLLDAVVMGAPDPGKKEVAYLDSPDPDDAWVHQVEGKPDRRLQFHSQQPLHLGLNDALPREPPVSRNYFAAVLRQTFLGSSSAGLTLTSVNPFGPRCTFEDIERTRIQRAALPPEIQANTAQPIRWDDQGNDCAGYGGGSAGIDFNLRTHDGEWVAMGTVIGSRRIGGPADDVQFDGTVIHPGDLGAGGYLIAGKLGGEGLRGNVIYRYSSPHLDLAPMGYLQSQNQQAFGVDLRYFRSRDIGELRELQTRLLVQSFWTTDGRWTPRGNYGQVETYVLLPSYDVIGLNFSFVNSRYDVREVRKYAVPLERQNVLYATLFGQTDPNRMLSLGGQIQVLRTLRQDVIAPQTGWGTQLTLFFRPWAWWETQLISQYDRNPQGGRYVACWIGPCSESGLGTKETNGFVFGRQDAEDLSFTLRQTFVFAPRLTLQVYAQLFSAGGHYPQFFAAAATTGDRIHTYQLAPLPGLPVGVDDPDFHDASLNLNVVLRWEYRLGSTLYVVYTRNQSVLGLQPDQAPTSGITPLRLGPGPAVDTFQVKWSYFFDL